jgi:hypothetical protein
MEIPDQSVANPYPSTIEVSGFTNGAITDLNVRLNGLSHTYPDDLAMMLSASHLADPTGTVLTATILSDVGDDPDAVNLNLVVDDQAPAPLPDLGPLVSGTFQPTNDFPGEIDNFESPAPRPTGNSQLATFNGLNPNGTWQLWVRDPLLRDAGNLAGWALEITAEVDA